MSRTLHTPTTPALAAYAAGRPILPIGHLPNGRAVYPIAGGADDPTPPQRPEGVTEEEWNALGDPGKRAIVREREARVKAETDLRAEKNKPTPAPSPAPTPGGPAPQPTPTPGPSPSPTAGDQPDIAKLIGDAVAEAMRPLHAAEQQRQTQAAAERVRDAVLEAAKARLHDPTDALGNVDLTAVISDQGLADPAKISTELDRVLAAKPHLAKSLQRVAPIGIGGGAPAATTEAEQVAAALAQMNEAAGIRPPAEHHHVLNHPGA